MPIAINSDEVLTPPVAAATVMVVRDGPSGLEVLLVRRHGNSGVLGGVHVFPGGKLDASDGHADSTAVDRTPVVCRDVLREPTLEPAMALGLHVAALRETFEECGLLLGQPEGAAHVQAVRALTATGTPFADALRTRGLPIATACVYPWSRWVTPRVPSVTNKRFDTRFFVAPAPDGQAVEHCAHEATEAVWLSPRGGLERYWAGEIDLAPPQIMSLSELSRLGDVAQVLTTARSRPPSLIEPEPFDEEGCRVICYPGDPRHSLSARVWPGPTRLVHRNHRFEPEGGLAALLG